MSGKLPRDTSNKSMQCFAPTRIENIADAGTYTPGDSDVAFRVNTTTTYQINGTGTLGTLLAGLATGIVANQTYLLTTGQNIEIM